MYKRMSGQPRKGRKKNSDEKLTASTNSYGRSRQEGHNQRAYNFFLKDS